MNAHRLLAHYDRIADAPDAIARLRQFIRDLAVRGKLVRQDPKDEPASELLKRMAAEKVRLIKAGDIRGQLIIDYAAFPVRPPAGWALSRLASVSRRIHYGFTASADQALKDVRMLRITDIQDNAVNWSSVPGCLIDAEDIGQYKLAKGDILIARTGGTIGKTFLVREVPVTAVFASYLIRVQGTRHVFDEYLKLFLESPLYWTQLREGTRGTGQPNVNGQTLGNLILPLPPLAEQRRIVATVDGLMALCDGLETSRVDREATRDRLAAASLTRINSPDPDTFQADALFVIDALPALTTRSEHIKRLRQTILTLAVHGKLVPQDPADRAVGNVALEIIAKRRGQLRETIESPFDLPRGWVWRAVATIADQVTDGEHATPPRIDDPQVPLVTAKNVRDGFMDYSQTDWVSFATAEKAWGRCRPAVGDLLLVCVGATTGRLTVLREPKDMVLVRSVALIRPNRDVASNYLEHVIRSPIVQQQIWASVKAAAQPCLYINRIQSLVVPLPPLAEQRRIVAKVDALMALCDRLEMSLANGDDTRSRLLDSLLAEALVQGDDIVRAEATRVAAHG